MKTDDMFIAYLNARTRYENMALAAGEKWAGMRNEIDAYASARETIARAYLETQDNWQAEPARERRTKAFDAMVLARRALIDAIGGNEGMAFVRELDDAILPNMPVQILNTQETENDN